jgi:uncharacterized phage protein gp47/JayE
MPFLRPSLDELIVRISDDIDARLPGADSKPRRSVLFVLARVIAGVAHGIYGLIDFVWRQIFVDTAEHDQLIRHAATYGIARKGAVAALGVVDLTGSNGATVPLAARLLRSDGVEYVSIATATIIAGVATLSIEALDGGTIGNAAAGQSLTFASPIAGINATAIVSAGGLISGAEEEGDEALRARLITRIQQPPAGGNSADYRAWALEVAGVTRAWVYSNELGIGTVSVRFVIDGRQDIIPTAPEVAAVQAYIDERRPAGMKAFLVVAPIARPVDFSIRLNPSSPAIRAAIREELADLFRREAVPGGTLPNSRLDEAISLGAGEYDHETLAPGGAVVTETGEMAILGAVEFI